jgi:translation initiation factor 4A
MEEIDEFKTFESMELSEKLLRGIYAYGFEKPSVIQQRAIKPFIDGRDIVAQSQSGTGKTGTFAISAIQRIDPAIKNTQGIIIAPTRELAKQIYTVTRTIGYNMDLNIVELIGGTKSYTGSSIISAQLIIGTPGKILDELIRGHISNKDMKFIILDEADEMLNKGFVEQIENIFNYIPQNIQIGLFSATIPNDIIQLIDKITKNPLKILIKNDNLTLEGIMQYYVSVSEEKYKYSVLSDIYSSINISQSIIFCNSKKKVAYLTEHMTKDNFTVSSITGDMSQNERNEVIAKLRDGTVRVLITTDILSRGIDVQQISLVINYELPLEKETYIHRIGRSGRFGRKGVAINLINEKQHEFESQKILEKFYSTHIEELPENIQALLN